MFVLRTLGSVGLYREAQNELIAVAVQPKRLALLTFLARAEPGVYLRRDTLVALFWPEADLEHARGALRQALRGLRQVLGDGVLLSRGEEELAVAPALLRCDAREFERAWAAGDLESAAGLYRGDFLEGFHIGETTPEFEQWVEGERSRLRHLAARTTRLIGEVAERSGDMQGAEEWARRAAVLTPDDETALARVIALLDRQGNRAGALAVYESFRRRLREAYDAEPSPETRRLVEAIRARETAGIEATVPSLPAEAAAESLPSGPPPSRIGLLRRPRRILLVGAVAGASITLALAATLARPVPVAAELDAGLVAVAPFRTSAGDTTLGFLRQAAAELLAGALTGEGGLRAVDPRWVLGMWEGRAYQSQDPTQAEVLTVAAGLGAGRMAQGSVVARNGHVELRVALLSVPEGEARAAADARGPIDSLSAVVDRLATALLLAHAGLDEARFAPGVPLAAMRPYLDGRAALRRGDWAAAVAHLDRALTIDSTFASAALALRQASAGTDGRHAPRAESIAWRYRDRLGERERLLFVTELGPNYPAWFPYADKERAWRALLASDWANGAAWRQLGTLYHFHGARLDMAKSSEEARIALERALEFDSLGGTPTRDQLLDIAAVTGNVALLKRALARAQPADSTVAELGYLRWLRAFTARDSGALDVAHEGFSRLGPPQLKRVWSISQRAGFDLRAAEAAPEHLARTDSDDQRAWVASMQYNLALNRGRPTEAQAAAGGLTPEWRPLSRLSLQVLAALYGDGDGAAGASAARALESELGKPLARDLAERRSQLIHACIAEQWRLTHRDMRSVDRTIAMLRSPEPGAPGWAISFYESCAAILESWRAAIEGKPDAWRLAQRTDSLMRSGTTWHWALPEHRVVARIWELVGDPARALTAVRRRRSDSVAHLAADLREEGRLAVLAADTAGAVRAFRHYLVLRSDPEPMLRPDRDRVRAVMARLQAVQGGAAP